MYTLNIELDAIDGRTIIFSGTRRSLLQFGAGVRSVSRKLGTELCWMSENWREETGDYSGLPTIKENVVVDGFEIAFDDPGDGRYISATFSPAGARLFAHVSKAGADQLADLIQLAATEVDVAEEKLRLELDGPVRDYHRRPLTIQDEFVPIGKVKVALLPDLPGGYCTIGRNIGRRTAIMVASPERIRYFADLLDRFYDPRARTVSSYTPNDEREELLFTRLSTEHGCEPLILMKLEHREVAAPVGFACKASKSEYGFFLVAEREWYLTLASDCRLLSTSVGSTISRALERNSGGTPKNKDEESWPLERFEIHCRA